MAYYGKQHYIVPRSEVTKLYRCLTKEIETHAKAKGVSDGIYIAKVIFMSWLKGQEVE